MLTRARLVLSLALVAAAGCRTPPATDTPREARSPTDERLDGPTAAASTGWPEVRTVTGVALPRGTLAASFVVW